MYQELQQFFKISDFDMCELFVTQLKIYIYYLNMTVKFLYRSKSISSWMITGNIFNF